jgi:WD40 repeat protein
MRQAGNVFDRLVDSGFSSKEMPDQDEMELSWVNGYRGFDCRNNLKYDATHKRIIYFTANLGIVLTDNNRERKQQYFRGHTDDILSMATYVQNEDTLVVTGQRGKANTFVWSAKTMDLKATFQTNQKSIAMLEFSKDGRLVISIGEDNTVAVTDWVNQRLIANVKGEPAATYHMVSSGDMGNLFLTCGDKYMRVWALAGRNLTSTKLSTSPKGKPQKFLSAELFGTKWIVGCENGWLYVIDKTSKGYTSVTDAIFASKGGGDDSQRVPAKAKKGKGGDKNGKKGGKGGAAGEQSGPAITAMHCTESVLVTGAKDGSVYLWNTEMQSVGNFNITSEEFTNEAFLSPQIQSVYFVGDMDAGCKVLLGTRGCDVLVVNGTGGAFSSDERSPVLHGHCNDELWGLAVHPFLPEYATVGDDKTLRVWNIHSRKMLACTVLGAMARACAFHPQGSFLAVGFGGRVGRGKQKDDGMVRVYSYPNVGSEETEKLVKMTEMRDSKQWISDIKFSPDGNSLAVGSHDNVIYIYSVSLDDDSVSLSLRGKFNKHNSYITHFDFSADGRFLQSNCGAYELLFCDTAAGKQITSASELRDVRWSSWTCTLGWPVQGIWPAGADGTDINAVDRSNSGHLIATSDDFGNVRVLRYPCVEEGANALMCSGHSSHVMNVRWTVGDEYLISCGGNDKSIFQWKHTISTTDGAGGSAAATEDGDDEDGVEDAFSAMALEEPSGGDEFMAVKPWRGAIRAPQVIPPTNPAAPSASLAIQWVHGYTSGAAGSSNTRISSNLFYTADQNVVYPAAALGVCLSPNTEDPSQSTQKYFTGHDDDILCLTISPCKRYVATGILIIYDKI